MRYFLDKQNNRLVFDVEGFNEEEFKKIIELYKNILNNDSRI